MEEPVLGRSGLARLWEKIKAYVDARSGSVQLLKFENVQVEPSAFAEDSTWEDYAYRAFIPLAGVSEDMIPDVTFAPDDAAYAYLAPVASSADGGVYIYGDWVPDAALTIPTITCLKE